MGTPRPIIDTSSNSPPIKTSKKRRARMLALRILRISGLLLASLVVGSYAVRSQPASVRTFLSPQSHLTVEGLSNEFVSQASVFSPSPAPSPSPLPSPMIALETPDFIALPPNHNPLPHVPSTAFDFLRPRPPLGVQVVINLNRQRLTVMRYKKVILESAISSGRASHPSTRGNFEVTQKDLHHFSTLYGYRAGGKYRPAAMKYFIRYNGAEGLHAGSLPGYPASHGCIRLPANKAATIFKTVGVGTPVVVTGAAPRGYRSKQNSLISPAATKSTRTRPKSPAAESIRQKRNWPIFATEDGR